MNRKIKFRGKQLNSGEWVYGFLVNCFDDDICLIGKKRLIYDEWYTGVDIYENGLDIFMVKKSTVGQFAGFFDINNKEVYEGDLVKVDLKYFGIKDQIGKIIFKDGGFGVQYGFSDTYFKILPVWDRVEVIGNVFDNPEVLKEVGDE